PGAHTARAHVAARAGVPVVARRAVRLVGVGARAVAVAGPGLVTLVGRRAGIRGPGARSARAHVAPRAGVPVVARRAIGLGGVHALAERVIEGSIEVALVRRGTRHRRRLRWKPLESVVGTGIRIVAVKKSACEPDIPQIRILL